ncbi:MAG: SMP-30/gluconolactonase/LRE family protein, partial [Ignavibacteriae bacterium]|nr:SMP-30/gluconolactonase/LRE family protein [Ignavibacteriota bacterium]
MHTSHSKSCGSSIDQVAGLMFSIFPTLVHRTLALSLLPMLCIAQLRPDLKFDHISLKDGLSNFTVTSIAQDRQGYLWFGTEDGLNRYDGYTFDQYLYDPSATSVLPSPRINSLAVSRSGKLWIGTQGGLVIHDPVAGTFERATITPGDWKGQPVSAITSLFEDSRGTMWIATAAGAFYVRNGDSLYRHDSLAGRSAVRCFAEDSTGTLWIGTTNGGLLRREQSGARVERIAISDNDITSLAVDKQNVLWIGTSTGLCRLDITSNRLQRYARKSNDPHSLDEDMIVDLLVDRRGSLWVGTMSIGLRKYNPAANNFFRFEHEPDNPHSLDKSRIQALFEDAGGLLWVSTYRGGLNRYDPRRDQFINIRPASQTEKGLSARSVYTVCEDKFGDVWIGTVGGGLNRYNPTTGKFKVYLRLRSAAPTLRRSEVADTLAVKTEAILSLYEDSFGELWIGAADALYKYDRPRDRFIAFPTPKSANSSRFETNVKCINEDATGTLWIGTHGGGVHRFNRATQTFRTYRTVADNPRSLSGMVVWSILRDHAGTMWFGTFGSGINRYNPATDDFTRFPEDRSSPLFSRLGSVYCITEGPDSALWIGSFAGGMHRFDPRTGEVATYLKRDGLPNNFVKAIVPDARGFLWASTDLGLSRFDPRAGVFRNYTHEDGLHDDVFLSGAYHRGHSGRLYFGGENGLTMFRPNSIQENTRIPPVVLKHLYLFDQEHAARGTGWMSAGVSLPYNQNFLLFEFAALDFVNPTRQQYQYIMEGFDREWLYSANRRSARYTNLPPGHYIFRVKGTNSDGVWNDEGTSLAITIMPPFWERWWFRIVVGLFILASMWGIYQYRVNKLLDLERLRIRIASDLHDDIGSSLTKISLQ